MPVLILYGGQSAKRNGTLAEVRAALGQREYREFGGIEPNPAFETLLRARALVQAEKLDFLLAVGGGSVIDGTKFVAAAASFEGDPSEYSGELRRCSQRGVAARRRRYLAGHRSE